MLNFSRQCGIMYALRYSDLMAYINDMPNGLSSICKYLFADDAKVYTELNCTDDYNSLQQHLDIMCV